MDIVSADTGIGTSELGDIGTWGFGEAVCVSLQDLSTVELLSPSVQPLHPVIYATAAVLLLCLLAVVATYAYHHRSVRVSRKSWHMLLNLCLHVCLTLAAFAAGINQTRLASVCQAVSEALPFRGTFREPT